MIKEEGGGFFLSTELGKDSIGGGGAVARGANPLRTLPAAGAFLTAVDRQPCHCSPSRACFRSLLERVGVGSVFLD